MARKQQAIVIATAGWVFVGTPVPASSDGFFALDEAAVIRRWGTTRGLGELALTGARAETVLDPAGYVELANHAVIGVIKLAPGVSMVTL
jgi:hypothetical protein